MMAKIVDMFFALIFTGITAFGAADFYAMVKEQALTQVKKGLSSTYRYTQRLTRDQFDWER